MKFNELINKSLTGEMTVYLNNNDLLDTRTFLFDSDFNIDDEKECEEFKKNVRKYWDYDVVWFKPSYMMKNNHRIDIIHIVIEEPRKEELPF